MSIRLEKTENGGMVIKLDERFDFESVGPFRKCYETLADVESKTVLIDFSETRYIDSSALGMLINSRSFFEKIKTKVKLVNTNEQIRKIFSISRFDKKFDIS